MRALSSLRGCDQHTATITDAYFFHTDEKIHFVHSSHNEKHMNPASEIKV
jgi:hypothetical protein